MSKPTVNTVIDFHGCRYNMTDFAMTFTDGNLNEAIGAVDVLIRKGSAVEVKQPISEVFNSAKFNPTIIKSASKATMMDINNDDRQLLNKILSSFNNEEIANKFLTHLNALANDLVRFQINKGIRIYLEGTAFYDLLIECATVPTSPWAKGYEILGNMIINHNIERERQQAAILTSQIIWFYYGVIFDDRMQYYLSELKSRTNIEDRNGIGNHNGSNLDIEIYQGWIYFARDKRFYKMNENEKMLLRNEHVYDIQINNGWVYFGSYPDNHIYKMKIDGSSRTLICTDKAHTVRVYKNFIYYQNHDDGKKLYRVSLNGTNREKLYDEDSYYYFLYDDSIYFNSNGLMKMNITSLKKTRYNTINCSNIIVYEQCIYYIVTSEHQIYKMDEKWKNPVLLADNANYFNIFNGYLYYTNCDLCSYSDRAIYKMKTDGSNKTKLINQRLSGGISIVDDWLYFSVEKYVVGIFNNKSLYAVHRMKCDGTNLEQLEPFHKY